MNESNQEKSTVELLKEKLFIQRKNAIKELSDDEIKQADDFCEDYKKFLNRCKTERECVSDTIEKAEELGFKPFEKGKVYSSGDRVYFNNRNKSLILAIIGKKPIADGVYITASHIDAPRLDLKPHPLYEQNDMAYFKTHYYGGIKKYQWTTILLALHGCIVKKDGTCVNVTLGENEGEPQFCITDLLPHLAREQMSKTLAKGIEGEDLNILVGSRPFKDDKGSELVKLNIMNMLYEKYGIVEEDFISAELEMVPSAKAVDIGFDRSMIGSYAHDDRVCSYSAIKAIFDTKEVENTAIVILADKEEVGSDGISGLKSSYLKYFIADLADMQGVRVRDVLSNSKCLSADVNAAFDPSFASPYETNNSCYINNGTVITKYTGSGGKYDTNDASAEYVAKIRKMLDDNSILWQTGELGKVDAGGGGTVAKYIGNLNVDTIDLGVPVLSMHAPLEIVSKTDVFMTYRAIYEFFRNEI